MLGKQFCAHVFFPPSMRTLGTLQYLFPTLVFNIFVVFVLRSCKFVDWEEIEIVTVAEKPNGGYSAWGICEMPFIWTHALGWHRINIARIALDVWLVMLCPAKQDITKKSKWNQMFGLLQTREKAPSLRVFVCMSVYKCLCVYVFVCVRFCMFAWCVPLPLGKPWVLTAVELAFRLW